MNITGVVTEIRALRTNLLMQVGENQVLFRGRIRPSIGDVISLTGEFGTSILGFRTFIATSVEFISTVPVLSPTS